MPKRTAFQTELHEMEDRLLAMADLAGIAIEQSTLALSEYDHAMANTVIEGDERINGMWVRIERETMAIIARQQPMATDLREILAVSAIATDIERIGDHAKSIARTALSIGQAPSSAAMVDILRMARLARDLLAGEMTAFVTRDTAAAQVVAARDNEVDDLYAQTYRNLIADMIRAPDTIQDTNRLVWVAKSIERIGDHVTNIGERIVFLTTGEFTELNV
jgi:phosphate transport system protein